jgi:hypothetical protein
MDQDAPPSVGISMRALLLGAGASFDAGMPLVTELTAELRRWLTADKLLRFNSAWRAKGGGWSDGSTSMLLALLQNGSMHYEQIIGAIEVEFAREPDVRQRQDLHAAHGFLLQAVRGRLLERQIKTLHLLSAFWVILPQSKNWRMKTSPCGCFQQITTSSLNCLRQSSRYPSRTASRKKLRIPAKTDSRSGDGGQPRSEAT